MFQPGAARLQLLFTEIRSLVGFLTRYYVSTSETKSEGENNDRRDGRFSQMSADRVLEDTSTLLQVRRNGSGDAASNRKMSEMFMRTLFPSFCDIADLLGGIDGRMLGCLLSCDAAQVSLRGYPLCSGDW